jgi:hypothetical protein
MDEAATATVIPSLLWRGNSHWQNLNIATATALCDLSGDRSSALLTRGMIPRHRLDARAYEAPRASMTLKSLLQLCHALLEPGHVFRKRRVAGSLLAQTQENGVPLL